MIDQNPPDYPQRNQRARFRTPGRFYSRHIFSQKRRVEKLPDTTRWCISPEGWAEFIQDISFLGKIAFSTHNSAAVLVTANSYPSLEYPPDRIWAANSNRKLSLDFTCWKKVVALREIIENKTRFSVEVFGHDGQIVHRLLLSDEADFRWFHRLVRFYGCHPRQSQGFPVAERGRAPWQLQLSQRAAWLHSLSGSGRQSFSSSILPGIFSAVQKHKIEMLSGVYCEAAIQRSASHFGEVGWTEEWLWARDTNAGVRVSLASLKEIWCVGGHCTCCNENRWTLEAYDVAQRLSFSLQVANGEHEPLWREILVDS